MIRPGSIAPRIAALGPQDTEAMLKLDAFAFAFDGGGADQSPTVACFEWDRTRGAYLPDLDGLEQLVGINAVYSLDLPVPGGSIDCAGLTWVGVHPGFRRRGVLTSMIGDHLRAVRERGEPVSALTASEPAIYGRFGYGQASTHVRATLPRGAALRDVPGADAVRIRLELADVETHSDVVGDCYEAARRSRPGMVSRNSPAQRRRRLDDPPQWREGSEALRIMIAEADDDGPARGYVLFRRTSKWSTAGSPDGSVLVRELVARDPATARALWGRLLDLDLTVKVETDERPTDDPLFTLMLDPRSGSPALFDGIWIRLVDLPVALAGRRYCTAVDVVFEVADSACPWNAGTWRLSAGPEHAECTPCTLPAAFRIDVRELGSAYLGSVTLDALAAAGLVTVLDEAGFAAASRAFSWPVAAHGGWRF